MRTRKKFPDRLCEGCGISYPGKETNQKNRCHDAACAQRLRAREARESGVKHHVGNGRRNRCVADNEKITMERIDAYWAKVEDPEYYTVLRDFHHSSLLALGTTGNSSKRNPGNAA